MTVRRIPSVVAAGLTLSAALVLAAGDASAASRQFNTFTPAADQAPPINPAVETLERCADCAPPTHAQPALERGCPTCPKKAALPPVLAADCPSCGDGDTRFSTAPFSTVTDTCADCEPFELHPGVGWTVDTDRSGTGVYLHDGSVFHRKADLDIPGRGFSFRFVRRHVSAVTYDGPLGKNWEFTYNARVDEDSGTGDVTLWDGTGREDVFTESSETYATPAGRFETLTRSGPPAKLHLVKPNGTDYLFDATTGRLESITDRFGNAMSFSYDGSDRLGTVTDTLGRDVTFAYDANDRIGTITDFDGRVWTYGYNGSGELVTVTTPGVTGFTSGKVTTYTYADGRLDTITDGRSQLVVDVTYTSGKATTVRYGDSGDDVDFDHDTPSAGKVTITDRNGNLTVVTVDANNQVSEVLEKTNRDIRSGEGDYTTSYTFNADLLLTGITFPAGNKAVYSYEASGSDNLTEEKFTNGAGTVEIWSTWTYTSLFSLVESYEELRGTTATGDEFVRTYLYDFDEATAGDLNGDGVTAGDDGALVKIAFPTVTSQSPSITPAETFRSNAHGQVTRWDRPDGEVTTFTHYSSGAQEGYLQKRVDDDTTGGLLLTTQWTYDDVGNVASVTDPNGWTTTYTVNALNQVEQETIPIASGVDFDVKYEYDGNDNLSKKEVENLDETGTAYSNAWITTSFTHETLNRVATRIDEVDASTTVTTTYTYDGNRNRTHVQRPEGNVVRTEWDERDLVHRITRGSGSTTAIPAQEERTWTGNRLLATRSHVHPGTPSDTRNTTTWTRDDFDRVILVQDALDNRRELTLDPAGNVTKAVEKGKNGGSYDTLKETDYHHNEAGWMDTRTDQYRKTPGDSKVPVETSYEFRKDGQPSKVTRERTASNSLVTTYAHDDAGRRVETQDDFGNTTTLTLDATGNVTAVARFDKAQAGSSSDVTRTVSTTYDRRNLRTSQVVDPGSGHLALTTTWGHDSRGNLVKQTDPRGNVQTYEHDGRNLRTKVTEALTGGTTTETLYGFDGNGNLVAVEDDNGHETTYAYDDLDRRVTRTDPDTDTYTWEYGTEDWITRRTDENGTVVEDTLDALGRVTHRDVTRATGVLGPEDEDYTWDALGRLTSAQNDDSTVSLKWDSMNRVYQESIAWRNTPAVTRTVDRDFDWAGNVTKLTYPDSSEIDYVIDTDADRIDQVKSGSTVLADYRYVGPFVDELEYGNGVIRSTTYDLAGRITQVDHDDGGTTVATFDYSFDANGNVLYEKRAHDNGLYEVFEHDKRDELVTAWYDATTSSSPSTWSKKVEYDWDGAWNLDQVTTNTGGGGVAVSYTSNSRNQYTAIGGATPSWTDNGELSDNDLGTTYSYDWRGQLVQVEKDRSTYTFEFDALGRRITTDFGTELRYAWAGERVVEEITSASSPAVLGTWVWGNDPEPIRMKRGSDVSYYHASRIGSVEKLTDASGTVVETVEYDAWGVPSISSSAGNVFMWRGEWYSPEVDIYGSGLGYDPSLTLRFVVPEEGSTYGIWLPGSTPVSSAARL